MPESGVKAELGETSGGGRESILLTQNE